MPETYEKYFKVNLDKLSPDISRLLRYFIEKEPQKNSGFDVDWALEKCLVLIRKDYNYALIHNKHSGWTNNYPSKIPVMKDLESPPFDQVRLHTLIEESSVGRYKGCYPVPVITYDGKYICRSSTMSGAPEMILKSGTDNLTESHENVHNPNEEPPLEESDTSTEVLDENLEFPACSSPISSTSMNREVIECEFERYQIEDDGSVEIPFHPPENNPPEKWALRDAIFQKDVELLNELNIEVIIDLMIEKHEWKDSYFVTTAEKKIIDESYDDFDLVALPYPSCDFFKKFYDNNYDGRNLLINWVRPDLDLEIQIPEKHDDFNVIWTCQTHWDLIELTQNYCKYIMECIQMSDKGVLIHSLNGCDRTPLFISLVRLMLWANGKIHKSLNEYDILFLILAYDWMLFNHDFKDNLEKNQDILFFCFYFLKYIPMNFGNLGFGEPEASPPRNVPIYYVNVDPDSDWFLQNESIEEQLSPLLRFGRDDLYFPVYAKLAAVRNLFFSHYFPVISENLGFTFSPISINSVWKDLFKHLADLKNFQL